MTLTELRYIVMLAKEQHFGRAAERCFVSQPTLSIAVKKLEEELGISLFERTKSRVRPTPTGERIVVQAQQIIEQTSAIKDLASEGKDQLSSPLSVGAIFTIGPYLFPHLIPKLRQSVEEMPLIIEEGYTAKLRTRLRNGELDVVILALPFAEPDVVTQPLYDEPFVVLLPPEHPLGKQKLVSFEDIASENLLLLGEGHCFRDQILDAFPGFRKSVEDSRSPVRTAIEGSSLETLRHMVASGLGITILPYSATLNSHYMSDSLIMRKFEAPVPSRTVALAWRASFPRSKAIDVLRQSIEQCEIPL